MSKNVIIGVLVLMSISLLGVVGLQLYWINDAIQVKQAEFDRSVNEALARVVEKLETQEAATVVANQMATLQRDTSAVDAIPTNQPLSAAIDQSIPVAKRSHGKTATAMKDAATAPNHSFAKASSPVTMAEPNHAQSFKSQTFESTSADPPKSIKLYFSKADSGQVKQIIKNISGAQTATVPSTTNGKILHYHRIGPSKAESLNVAHLRKGDIYQLEQVPDSINFLRINNKPVRISVDTLRTMALKMDSLMQRRQFKPTEIASVDIRNDSVFIIQNSEKKPLYVAHSPALRSTGIPPGRSRTYTRGFVEGKAKAGTHVFTYTTPAATSPANKDTLKAAAKPLKLAKVPTNKIKASAISRVNVKKDMLNDVVQKMVVEYVVKDEPLKNRLNLQTLPKLLKTELENKGISMDFGYWVVSGQHDTVASHNIKPLKVTEVPKYKASLFPNDIFEKTDYLGLYFADSRTYAIRSLWGMLSLSALFTLVIIATFGTTIHIIYKQKKLSEMKNDFINNMTHEFKTPIATISLATDAIANPKIYEHPEKIKHYTGIIRQENKRMNAQVENVLQIAQLEKNDFKLNFKPVDVHILITKAIESIRLQVEERLGQINIQLNALHHELRSDEVHLFNVICNLLDNANKYSPSTPEINLVTQNVEGGLLIAVEDKGMGMSKETQQRVFDKFYRVPTGNLHNVKGFGLGLSYVKAIVQAHKGNVRLKSEPGKGSRFEIYLPLS